MDNKDLFKYAEKKANLFNLYCLLIIGVLGFIAMLLNEIGIFKLDRQTMRATMIQLAIYGSIPAIMFFFHDKLLRKNHSILEDSFFKWVIIAISFMEAIDMCTIFSFHGTVLLVIPPLIGAQYKHDKYISVINSTQERPRRRVSELVTSKLGEHGFGLRRIDKITEKYDGYVNRKNEPGVFATEVMLPL